MIHRHADTLQERNSVDVPQLDKIEEYECRHRHGSVPSSTRPVVVCRYRPVGASTPFHISSSTSRIDIGYTESFCAANRKWQPKDHPSSKELAKYVSFIEQMTWLLLDRPVLT